MILIPLSTEKCIFYCWFSATCPIHTSNIPSTKSHIHFLLLMSFIQGIHSDLQFLVIFRNKLIFYSEELLAPCSTRAGAPPLVGCQLLLIQYIHSYPPYLEDISSICNLRMRHALVTRDPPNMGINTSKCIKYKHNGKATHLAACTFHKHYWDLHKICSGGRSTLKTIRN
jgi:hypothetical protein